MCIRNMYVYRDAIYYKKPGKNPKVHYQDNVVDSHNGIVNKNQMKKPQLLVIIDSHCFGVFLLPS